MSDGNEANEVVRRVHHAGNELNQAIQQLHELGPFFVEIEVEPFHHLGDPKPMPQIRLLTSKVMKPDE